MDRLNVTRSASAGRVGDDCGDQRPPNPEAPQGPLTPAPRDGRTSLRHHQGQHGSNPFSDEDAATSCLRDGATRAGLQSDPGHEHHGHSAAHGSDEGLAKPEKRLLNATRPKLLRFDTSGKAFLHNQDPKLTVRY